jgi:hypothetical protein
MRNLASKLKRTIDDKFGGCLAVGSNSASDGTACILEAYSVALGEDWTDDPDSLGIWDIRYLNDIEGISSRDKVDKLVKLTKAYQGSNSWSKKRGQKIVDDILLELTRKVFYPASSYPGEGYKKLRNAKTVKELLRDVSDLQDTYILDSYSSHQTNTPELRISLILKTVGDLAMQSCPETRDPYDTLHGVYKLSPLEIFNRTVSIMLKAERKHRD